MAWGPGGWVKDPPKEEAELGMPPAPDDAQVCAKTMQKINKFILQFNGKNDNMASFPQARKVVRVYPPEEDGTIEALYIDADDAYMTAYLRGTHVSVAPGW